MVERDLEITNQRGLHARAAAKFVKLAGTFEAKINVSKDGTTVSGDSIMGLITLAATIGSAITVRADGADEREALSALTGLVANGFEEG
jgi:phosphocarrier protein HPr